jgi:hypothetical protein
VDNLITNKFLANLEAPRRNLNTECAKIALLQVQKIPKNNMTGWSVI